MSFIPEEKANSIPKIADGGTTVKGFDVGKRKNPKPKNTSSIIAIYVLSDCVFAPNTAHDMRLAQPIYQVKAIRKTRVHCPPDATSYILFVAHIHTFQLHKRTIASKHKVLYSSPVIGGTRIECFFFITARGAGSSCSIAAFVFRRGFLPLFSFLLQLLAYARSTNIYENIQ